MKEEEKVNKYRDLGIAIKSLWNMKHEESYHNTCCHRGSRNVHR